MADRSYPTVIDEAFTLTEEQRNYVVENHQRIVDPHRGEAPTEKGVTCASRRSPEMHCLWKGGPERGGPRETHEAQGGPIWTGESLQGLP